MDRALLAYAIGVGDPDDPEAKADKLVQLMQDHCKHRWVIYLDFWKASNTLTEAEQNAFCGLCGKDK